MTTEERVVPENDEPLTIDELIANVRRDVNRVKAANQDTLTKAIEGAFGAATGAPKTGGARPIAPIHWWFWFCVFLIPVSAVFLLWLFPSLSELLEPKQNESPPFDLKIQLAFMAFVLAMASYLASVTREIVKKLEDEPNDKESRVNIAWIVIAEINLIALGLETFVRIVRGPRPVSIGSWIFPLESLLVWHLITTVAWLMINHGRIWWNKTPWRWST